MRETVFTLENLACANCAAKIEAKINALPEVESATVTFATKQLRITAEDPDGLIEELTQIARSVEREIVILPRDGQKHDHNHGSCSCGNHCACSREEYRQEHPHSHPHGHGSDDKKTILAGAGLFAGGVILNLLGLKWVAIPVFLLAYVCLGWQILAVAWKNLSKGHVFDENFLMSIATLGALLIQQWPEAVGVMLFYRIGAYFEEKAVTRSRSQILEAVDLRPEVVILADGRTIPAGEAKIGDLLILRPGDRIPLDGTVSHGHSRIDTAPITGEPVPVSVHPGDGLTSGCINVSGQLVMEVCRPLAESMVTRILNSVENAAAGKPKIDRFITRFARIYTPIVVALAAFVAIVPAAVTGDWHYWVYTALSFLVMSCPCALVLSVPLAFFSGIGVGSKQGILFKGGLSMEALGRIKAVVMDKTGTLTRGDFRVQQLRGSNDVLSVAAACEQFSTHPIAVSILQAAREQGLDLAVPEKVEELAGRGIKATLNGVQILCGSKKLMADHSIALPAHSEGSGTCVFVAADGRYLGQLLISDTVKSDARRAVARLKQQGLRTAMLTGDNPEAAEAIAGETGIDEVRAKLLPDEKLTALQQLRRTYGALMYVGDGINDAPVLAGADVGAAMGSGADAAIEAADVVFMTSAAAAIPEAVDIARQTGRIAWQNVVFALAVKVTVMLLGLGGHASMWMAVFADSGVAMLCVLNSIRLLYRKHNV